MFPFGHGLSYTTFEYTNLLIDSKEINDTETVSVHVTVKNTGTRTGKEIVQLYVQDVESTVIRPEKELKGFAKVELQPGEQKKITFTLDKRSFAYYNVALKDWHVESGDFAVLIGRSSEDIVLGETLRVQSTVPLKVVYHRNSLLGDLISDTEKGPIVQSIMQQVQAGMGILMSEDNEMADMMAAMMKFMPLRSLVSFSQGAFTDEMLNGLLHQLNHS